MFLLVVGLAVTGSLAIVLSICMKSGNRRHGKHDGIKVVAMVIDVQVKQNWKDGEEWHRDAWSGSLKREKIWQTYYDVLAQWRHPQTGQHYTSRATLWSDEVTKIPAKGDTMLVLIDLRNPQQCRVVTA